MNVDKVSGNVTTCERGRLGLYTDDQGLIVRNAASRPRRFAWTEVSRFADGSSQKEGEYSWVLLIALHTGRKIPVHCTITASPSPETLAAIRQAAGRYGIPADLSGVPAKDQHPAERALYADPAGEPGLRYWDGRQWSPLLPQDIKPPWKTVRDSPASWSALPVAWGGGTTQQPGPRRIRPWALLRRPSQRRFWHGGC